MIEHLTSIPLRVLLIGIVACVLALVSAGRATAGAPNPCTLLTVVDEVHEAETALEAPLDGEPIFSDFGAILGFGACSWFDTEGDFMGLRWSNSSEEDAAFLYDETIAPFSTDVAGLGDRAKWVSQVELDPFIWFELRVQAGRHYLSLEIDKTEELVPCTLGCPQFKQVDNTQKMQETMAVILGKLVPRPAVEFTQAIQELQSAPELIGYLATHSGPPVPIIAGKPAAARVYFDDVDEAGQRTVELSGVGSDSTTVAVSPDCSVEMQRKQEGSCQSADLYFTPPAGEWTATFKVRDGNGQQIDEFEYEITSFDSPEFAVGWVPVCVALTAGADPTCPSFYVEGLASLLTRTLYPVAPNKFSYGRMPVPEIVIDAPLSSAPERSELIANLRMRWEFLSTGSSPEAFSGDQLAGWLPDGGVTNTSIGVADPLRSGGSGHVSWQLDTSSLHPLLPEFSLAHEIGHNLGLRHTNRPDGCGAVDPATDWPYAGSTIQEVGFDVAERQARPQTNKDLMTYCLVPPADLWISPHSYTKLAEGSLQPQSARTSLSGAASQYLLIKGTAQADGSAGAIDAAFVIDSTIASVPSNPLGNHCLHLTGGAQIDYCFNLAFTEHQSGAPLDEESFVVRVPLPPGTTDAFLMRSNDQLATLELSLNAPTVEITSPAPGAEWSGEQTIEWTSSDADGGPMNFAVLYSPDGGANWLPMDVGSENGEFTFDTREIIGGDVMLRVLASDGLNTTDDVVAVSVNNGEPRTFGDNDCDGDVDAVDGLKGLQEVAGLPYGQNEGCTPLGESVGVSPAGVTERPWGDVDCDGDVDAADGLSILRFVAALPVNQEPECPAVGSAVLVG